MNLRKEGLIDLVSLSNDIYYILLNLGQIDLFSTVYKYFHPGMDQTSILEVDTLGSITTSSHCGLREKSQDWVKGIRLWNFL